MRNNGKELIPIITTVRYMDGRSPVTIKLVNAFVTNRESCLPQRRSENHATQKPIGAYTLVKKSPQNILLHLMQQLHA